MIGIIRTKSARLLAVLAALFIIAFTVCPLCAFADNKSYSVDGAEFRVTLTQSGEAIIYEKWDVTYHSGEFSKFYKDIYNPNNALEYIKNIDIMGAAINGKTAEYQSGDNRADGSYYVESKSDRFTVSWYQHALGETVEYEIKYNIKDAVKSDGSGRAKFAVRLIGENFPKTVGSVKTV
ncbi:hypothetical protein, partial [Ruminococcus sp.]